MQELEVLTNQINRLIAKQSGKQPKVHFFQGRQLMFGNQTHMMFLLPHNVDNGLALQVTDTLDPNLGMDLALADLHPADGTKAIIP